MFTLSPSGLLTNVNLDYERYGDSDPTFISRYLIFSGLLDAYKHHHNAAKLKVLDAGGSGSILADFSDADVTILDILPNKYKAKQYVRGNVLTMPFSSESFDVVVSSDVLEHIDEKDRPLFLKECARVSKDLVLIAAPFNLDGVRPAEISANEFYKKMTGANHPWLMEHLAAELPNLRDAIHTLEYTGLNSGFFTHTALDNWQLVTRTGFLLSIHKQYPEFTNKIKQLNSYYLKNLMAKDFSKNGYRTFVIASKRHEVDIQSVKDIANPLNGEIYTMMTDAILELI